MGNDLLKRGLKEPASSLRGRPQCTASVIAPLFQGTGSVEALHRFPGWLHLVWSLAEALYIELAGECYELAPMSRNSQSSTVHKRCADSISSFVVIQRQKQNVNQLPIQSVKDIFSWDITREITPKLSKSIHHHYDFLENQRAKTMENIMEAHEKGIPVMWEVYSGDALLVQEMELEGDDL